MSPKKTKPTTIKRGYILLIEWDGKAPPTSWYNRLHAYGLRVRGNKDQGPLARREASQGVVFQEGAVVVNSASFAHLLAAFAMDMGAKTVSMGLLEVDQYLMSAADSAAFDRVTASQSKRGPKTHKHEGWYTITCFEEGIQGTMSCARNRPIARAAVEFESYGARGGRLRWDWFSVST